MKAQAAYEYILLFFVLAAAFTLWSMFHARFQADIVVHNDEKAVSNLARSLQDELYIVAQQPVDFRTRINIPATINGHPYELTVREYADEYNYLEVRKGDVFKEVRIPSIQGLLSVGENTIVATSTGVRVE